MNNYTNKNIDHLEIGIMNLNEIAFFFHRRLKKPLKPKVILQVSTPGSKDSVPTPIPILGARICHQDILIVHGNFIKPTFEKVVCTCYF